MNTLKALADAKPSRELIVVRPLLEVGRLGERNEGSYCTGARYAVRAVERVEVACRFAIAAAPRRPCSAAGRSRVQAADRDVAAVAFNAPHERRNLAFAAFDQLAEALAVEQQRTSDAACRVVGSRGLNDVLDDAEVDAIGQLTEIEDLK